MEDVQQVNQVDSSNQSPPPANPPLNQKRNILLIIGVLVFIVVLAGGYVLHKKVEKQLKNQPAVSQQAPSPAPTSDETANWKTYTNSNFTFKYPESWYSQDNPNYPGGNNVSFFLVGTTADHGYGDHKGNEIFSFEFSDDSRSLEELKKEYYQSATDLTVDGKPAIKTSFNLFIVKPSDNKKLNIVGGSGATNSIIDQILSTFRFD